MTPQDFVSALLYQLLQLRTITENDLKEVPALKTIASSLSMKTSSGDLWNVLTQLLASLSSSSSSEDQRPLICIVDALDQCADNAALDFLHYLHRDLRTSAYPIKVLITCRRDYVERLPPVIATHNMIRIDEENSDDINLCVKQQLQPLLSESSELEALSKLEVEIAAFAQGVFPRVALVTEGLLYRGISFQNVLKTIRRFPKDQSEGLTQLYGQILKHATSYLLDDQLVLNVKSILNLVMATARPLSLTEIMGFLEVEATNTMRSNLEQDVKTICRGLLRLDGDFVKPIHWTLRTYLDDSATCLPQFYTSQREKHVGLAQICLKYTIDRLKLAASDEQGEIRAILENDSFLEYAATRWPYHSQSSKTADPTLIGLIHDLLGNTSNFQKWLRVILTSKNILRDRMYLFRWYYDEDNTSDFSSFSPTPAHVLSLIGLPSPLFEALFQSETIAAFSHEALGPWNMDSYGGTPAHWAAGYGQTSNPLFVETELTAYLFSPETLAEEEKERPETLSYVLTSFPDSVNCRNKFGQTPLHIACSSGRCRQKVQVLLNAKVDVQIQDTRGFSGLHLCSGILGTDAAKLLVSSGANVNVQTLDGHTPLHIAAVHGQEQTVKLLIDHGAKPDAMNKDRSTPLQYATSRETDYVEFIFSKMTEQELSNLDDSQDRNYKRIFLVFTRLHVARVETIKVLVAAGADVNHKDSSGSTALHTTAAFGYLLCTETLLSLGANPNIANEAGVTPLMGATLRGTELLVEWLVNAGADTTATDTVGDGLLHHAAKMGHQSLVTRFIAENAGINIRNASGSTPLHIGVATNLGFALKLIASRQGIKGTRHAILEVLKKHKREIWLRDHEEIVKILLSAGADCRAVNNGGTTPLVMAAFHGNESLIEILIENGADVNTVDSGGNSCLYMAALAGSDTCIQTLLKHGAEIKASNLGITPLHCAAQYGNVLAVKILLEAGDKVDSADQDGDTVLHLIPSVSQSDYQPTELPPEHNKEEKQPTNDELEVAAIVQRGRDWETMEEDQLECFTLVLSKGADANAVNKAGNTPLMMVASAGRVRFGKSLLDFDADINHMNDQGAFAIHAAVSQGHPDFVNLLLDRGDDPNRRTKLGVTPLMNACLNSQTEIMQLLYDRGADIDASFEGCSALHMVAEQGLGDIVKWLINRSVDVNAADSEGKTALDIASEKNHKDIIQQLADAGATRSVSGKK